MEIYYSCLAEISDVYIDGLVQERLNSIAYALDLRRSCTNPSIWRCALVWVIQTISAKFDVL